MVISKLIQQYPINIVSAVVHNQSIGVIEEQVFYSIMANSKKSKDVSNGYISTSSPK